MTTAAGDAFRAYRVRREEGAVRGRVETVRLDDLDGGDVVIRACWSDVNYKDALAATGAGRIMRRFPMIGGIDVAGRVLESADDRYRAGDPVVITGFGLSEDHDGGYSERVRVPADWLVPLPEGLSLRDSMALGTAGFTAALAVDAMQHNRQTPDKGPILVNGATGGVGGFAIDMLSALGYEVVAFTGKRDRQQWLHELGAREVLVRGETEMGTKPLEAARFGGAVDNVGGDELAWLTRSVAPGGNIASIGLAGGSELHTTVMPFILRGVNLLGINSIFVEPDRRVHVWHRLANDLRPRHLERMVTRTVGLDGLEAVFPEFVAGTVTGRTLVRLDSDEGSGEE